MREKMKCSAGK